MAMFDDPKKELQRLEEQLRAEEEFDDELAGIEDLLQDYEEEDFSGCFREPEEDDVAYRRPDAYTRNMSDMLLEEEAPEAPKKQKPKKEKGIVGLAIMALLVWLGALDLLSPVNMFLYQLVWMLPALLITEWTRSV